MAFDTQITTDDNGTLTGPERAPKQMLADQEYDGHVSVHDGDMADKLGLAGAPIEGPTHFSQFDPLAYSVWGDAWFEHGCISSHFLNMVVEGETVTASMSNVAEETARIDAVKGDGSPVLTGTASIDPAAPTELSERLAKMQARDVGDLFIYDQVQVGTKLVVDDPVTVDATTPSGKLYPFSLRQKLAGITERTPWYDDADNPWGRPILPFEMYSVLTNKVGAALPIRGPAVGLFIDLEVRAIGGPLFVGENYLLEREVMAVGQSRKVESAWVQTTVRSAPTGEVAATVLLHSGSFKASYAKYPADRL